MILERNFKENRRIVESENDFRLIFRVNRKIERIVEYETTIVE